MKIKTISRPFSAGKEHDDAVNEFIGKEDIRVIKIETNVGIYGDSLYLITTITYADKVDLP